MQEATRIRMQSEAQIAAAEERERKAIEDAAFRAHSTLDILSPAASIHNDSGRHSNVEQTIGRDPCCDVPCWSYIDHLLCRAGTPIRSKPPHPYEMAALSQPYGGANVAQSPARFPERPLSKTSPLPATQGDLNTM